MRCTRPIGPWRLTRLLLLLLSHQYINPEQLRRLEADGEIFLLGRLLEQQGVKRPTHGTLLRDYEALLP